MRRETDAIPQPSLLFSRKRTVSPVADLGLTWPSTLLKQRRADFFGEERSGSSVLRMQTGRGRDHREVGWL